MSCFLLDVGAPADVQVAVLSNTTFGAPPVLINTISSLLLQLEDESMVTAGVGVPTKSADCPVTAPAVAGNRTSKSKNKYLIVRLGGYP